MSRLNVTIKVVLGPIIFALWLFGVDKYVGEDRFVDYWKAFDKR